MSTEKYFIVTKENRLREEWLKYVENHKTVNTLFNEFVKKHNIEAREYATAWESLYIIPTENDAKNFEKMLKKDSARGLREFKANSLIRKEWNKVLDENKITPMMKPHVGMFFKMCYGKHYSRIFDMNDVVYCSLQCDANNIDCPEGMIEIKASEFYKVIENIEEKSKQEV